MGVTFEPFSFPFRGRPKRRRAAAGPVPALTDRDTMKQHKVRRLPVIDGKKCIGMVSQGDIALNVSEDKVGDLVEAISAAP